MKITYLPASLSSLGRECLPCRTMAKIKGQVVRKAIGEDLHALLQMGQRGGEAAAGGLVHSR